MSDQYPVLYSSYQWLVPTQLNIAHACLRRWSGNIMEGRRIAIQHEDAFGTPSVWNYTQLADVSNRLANGLRRMGLQKGERVAVIMSQRPEAVAAMLAVLGCGAVLVPLPPQVGRDGLALRLRDAEARSIIADAAAAPELNGIGSVCPSIRQVIGLDFQNDDTLAWRTLLARQAGDFEPIATSADDPAILLYTAGTTGMPKGVLHAHRVLIGILPAFVAAQNWFPRPGDVFWSSLDWSTAPGLLHGLLAAMYFGRPQVTTAVPPRGHAALSLLGRYRITNALMSTGDLTALQDAAEAQPDAGGLSLRAVMVAGETVPGELHARVEQTLGVVPNEAYGLTEAPGIIGHSHEKWPARPGSMGRPTPGHRISLIDPEGRPCRSGAVGQLVLHMQDAHGHPDPCLFLSYWRNDALTQARYRDGCFLTGDMATRDEDGYYWYVGRSDDVFRAGNYRVSPIEIEDCLKQHASVTSAAVVPKPRPGGGNAIKAFVVLDAAPTDDLAASAMADELRTHVRARLATWQVPGDIEFVERLPVTPDGQLRRHVLRAREQQRSMLAAARREPRKG